MDLMPLFAKDAPLMVYSYAVSHLKSMECPLFRKQGPQFNELQCVVPDKRTDNNNLGVISWEIEILMKLNKTAFLILMTFSLLLMPVLLNQRFSNFCGIVTETPLPFLVSESSWEDNCTDSSLWMMQSNESGFSTLNPIASSGSLTSSAGYFSVTDILAGNGIEGPLFTRAVSPQVSIRNLSSFQADLELVYQFNEIGYLSLCLFDEFGNIVATLQISDYDVTSSSGAICTFHDEDSETSALYELQYLFSWRSKLSIWYDDITRSVVAQIDDGTPKNQTLLVSGQFNENREIAYIGIQVCRSSSNYVGDHLRVHDIQLSYREIVVESTDNSAATSSPPSEEDLAEDDSDDNGSLSNENRDVFPIELVGAIVCFALVGYAMYVWPKRDKAVAEPFFKTDSNKSFELLIERNRDMAGEEYLEALKDTDAKSLGKGIHLLRGCELVGFEFVYKVKIVNNTESVITNVSVTVLSYPEDCMSLEGSITKSIPKIEPGGYRSPQFTFSPTKDCVQGAIQATVSFIDHMNNPHSSVTKPFQIRSVCDLLKPFEATNDVLEKLMLESPSTSFRETIPLNARDLFDKAKMMLPAKNFHLTNVEAELKNGSFNGRVQGSAIGKYTGKRVEVRIQITGSENSEESQALIFVSGDDDAMLPAALSEFSQGMNSWLCVHCGAPLSSIAVANLLSGHSVQCDFCTRTLTFRV